MELGSLGIVLGNKEGLVRFGTLEFILKDQARTVTLTLSDPKAPICEDFYIFVGFLCPTSITSGTTVAETLLMILPLE